MGSAKSSNGTYSKYNCGSKTEGGPNDFAVAWVLICSALEADPRDGEATHDEIAEGEKNDDAGGA